jgi:AcrR family transcriptional regulator
VSVKRLTRAEAQAQTRERLLDAAEEAFAAEGFAGTSLDRIADAAGFTRGAVYSNFSDKADLFVAVRDRRRERRTQQIADAMQSAGDPATFIGVLRDPSWQALQSDVEVRRWVMLNDEFRLFAMRHPEASTSLAAHERRLRDSYVEATRHLLGQLGVDAPANERLIAAVLFALDESLVRQHLVDPADVPPYAFADAVDLLLRAAEALSRTATVS